MTVERMDNVGIVVEDLDAAQRVEIAMMRTPDGLHDTLAPHWACRSPRRRPCYASGG